MASGCIRTGSGELSARLQAVFAGVSEVIRLHGPVTMGIEQVFMARNADSALKLGQARGIAMLVPALAGLPVAEYAPNAVKKAVIGVGHGDKKQIHMMVRVLMPKATFDTDDAADALAIAICHSWRGALSAQSTPGKSKDLTERKAGGRQGSGLTKAQQQWAEAMRRAR